jgi:hypothetical protein
VSQPTDLPQLDPFAEEFLQFPFATRARLRQQAPVHVERIDVIHDEPLRYLPSLIVRGLVALPVRVRRRLVAEP